MDIDFVWTTPTTTEFRDDLESKIRDDIESDSDMRPCHSGKITVELSSTDPLEATVNGKVVCSAVKFLRFSQAQLMDQP